MEEPVYWKDLFKKKSIRQSDRIDRKKQEIAKLAATLVNDHDMIFINSGSTAFLLLNYLSDRNVTIITNNGRAIFRNPSSKAEIVLSGGEIYEKKKSLVGDFALYTFSKVTANICFLGVGRHQ